MDLPHHHVHPGHGADGADGAEWADRMAAHVELEAEVLDVIEREGGDPFSELGGDFEWSIARGRL